ncbi:hypothetical protein K1X13_05315 [Nocardioides sp. WL0053]|uniref:DUF222 domain-containing protein n=1 Tax=Nocardioides jiangsuensis TaxID=2866161 RepID=A0ABS7RGS3_9ACTN|nr:hypothetical protein [Nocardioides jiangsuensis]MBY9074237.1 hypothetical protein [Nocardioides jiangsuensis]
MEHADDGQPFVTIPVGDSPDSRLFIELSSYGSDLADACHALDLAIRGLEEGSELADASRHLVGLAVVAYCRAVLPSNVRGRLTDHVDIPDELIDVHDRVKAYRNATVAHSQSELAVTYAVGVLDSDTLRVRDVTGATVLVPLPNRAVREFQALIDVMERRLDGVIEPVRHRLMKKLAEMERSRVEAAVRPDITEKWAHEFNPKTKRPRYPTGHTVYWDVAADDATDE